MFKRFLSAVALALFSLPLIALAQQPLTHTKDSLEAVKENLQAGKAIIVDVREQSEWDAGHLKGAVLIPQSKLKAESQLSEVLKGLPKDKIKDLLQTDLDCIQERHATGKKMFDLLAAVSIMNQKNQENADEQRAGYGNHD